MQLQNAAISLLFTLSFYNTECTKYRYDRTQDDCINTVQTYKLQWLFSVSPIEIYLRKRFNDFNDHGTIAYSKIMGGPTL